MIAEVEGVSTKGWTTEADLLDGQRTDAGEIRRLIETGRYSFEDIAVAREGFDALIGPLNAEVDTTGVTVTDVEIPAPDGPVPARVARFTSSSVRAPWAIARWIVPRRILLQRQTTLYESTISCRRRSSSS